MTVLVKPRVETRTKTTTDIKITSEIIESMDFTVFDDIFDGLIPFGDEDDRGGGDESCDSLYEECDHTAKYYIMFADHQGQAGQLRQAVFLPEALRAVPAFYPRLDEVKQRYEGLG